MPYAKSEATVNRILNAAETLFVTNSYASVSMQGIADQADVTKGALYHHFDSKESLYVAMMMRDLEAKETLSVTAISVEGSARQRLRNHTSAFLELTYLKRQLIQLVRRDINFFEGEIRNNIVRAYQAALPNQIEKVIRDGIKAGEFIDSDPRLLAWSYVALVEVVLAEYAAPVLADRKHILDYVLQLFFSGAGNNNNSNAT